jgi:hypothetical protein
MPPFGDFLHSILKVGRKAPRAPESAPRRSVALSMRSSSRLAKQRSVLSAYVSTGRAAATPQMAGHGQA